MKAIKLSDILQFELTVMDFAEICEVTSKDDLERFSSMLHEHIETAIQDYAMDEGIEDYEPQY